MDFNPSQKKLNLISSSTEFADIQKHTEKTEDTEIIIPNLSLGSNREPQEKEIQEMAQNLGIDLANYPQMVDLVVKAIKQPIFSNWGFIKTNKEKHCIDLETQQITKTLPLIENWKNDLLRESEVHTLKGIDSKCFDDIRFEDSSVQEVESVVKNDSIFHSIHQAPEMEPKAKVMTFNNLDNNQSTEKKTILEIYSKIDHLQRTIETFGQRLDREKKTVSPHKN